MVSRENDKGHTLLPPYVLTPQMFIRLSGRLLPWLMCTTGAALLYGLYLVFFVAPPDYQQGITVRIMYIHVPAAWLSLLLYAFMSLNAFGILVWRQPLADIAHQAAAPIGATLTFICLLTGSIWGRPTWGTWWVWDARLTSQLILLLFYLVIITLRTTFEGTRYSNKQAIALITLVGCINLPIIKFSVEWWNTLHQPASVLRLDGRTTIHMSFLIPLLVMTMSLLCLTATLHMIRMRTLLFRQTVRRMYHISLQERAPPCH